MTKKFKIPKSLAVCADTLYQLRADRLELQKQIDEMKKNETALKEHIINNLPKSNASGISGKVANAKITKKPVPHVKDWDKFTKFVKKTGDFSLMQRRINDKAIRERWEDKKTVPGIDKFEAIDVSCTKL